MLRSLSVLRSRSAVPKRVCTRAYSVASYNAQLGKETTETGVVNILEKMKSEGVEPNVETYKLVMSHYQKTWPERKEAAMKFDTNTDKLIQEILEENQKNSKNK
eukprot:TRINITY_DN2505_c0_g1_i2.p1 TRINITY_DN2505_c0_g1~~TRINITY_DN2505_c0_g1_i2.p1  ORF type:complete len:104 (+),score=22.13 TRINITY_DN2505_c0_g1_i2:36-347(+)